MDTFRSKGIAVSRDGTRVLGWITSFPVQSTADFKGRKIAATGPNLPWISGVGAVPVQSNLPEATGTHVKISLDISGS